MTRRIISILAAAVAVFCPICKAAAQAQDTLVVTEFRYVGPFAVARPFMMDSTDASGKTFDLKEAALSQSISLEAVKKASVSRDLPVKSDNLQTHLAGFSIETSGFAKADVIYSGPESHKMYLDGKPFFFKREKPRELLALLVDRRGAALGAREAMEIVWPEKGGDDTSLFRMTMAHPCRQRLTVPSGTVQGSS